MYVLQNCHELEKMDLEECVQVIVLFSTYFLDYLVKSYLMKNKLQFIKNLLDFAFKHHSKHRSKKYF